MAEPLPPRPDIEWLRKAAKQRLAALRAEDPAARLHQAQLALARAYGFASWRALKAHVDGLSLNGQILAVTLRGRARELEALLAAHPARRNLTGGSWNRPLLHLAAEAGHLACVELLLRLGVEVDQRDRADNATALHWAAAGGHLAVVDRLLAAGADPDGAGDEHELGAIGWATCFRQTHAAVAERLLAAGAAPTFPAAIALGRDDLVRSLAAADPTLVMRPMSRFDRRRTPLHLAVIKNRPEMVRLLLGLGADPRAVDGRGDDPLDGLPPGADPEIARLLAEAGARPKDTSPRFRGLIPILNVRNVPAAIAYYRDKLGFRLDWEWGDPPGFACIDRGSARIFLCQGAQGGPGMWLCIDVEDVDALHREYQASGAIIRQPPTNFPWGMREMNVEDLDGHRLRMGGEATGSDDGVDLMES
jgi:uncharacterized glyoxalase superfamily protein PhnB